MLLSIIIVNWNVKDLLEKCLTSIYRSVNSSGNKKDSSFEVFVVDNGSKDESVEMVQKEFPQVKLIINKENLGFAKANNQAIKQTQSEFILLLNPDTEILQKSSLFKMIDFMKAHPDCGIAGCKLLNTDRTLQLSIRRFPTLISQIIILTKTPNFFPWLVKEYLGFNNNYQKIQKVDQVMGSFFMIRKKVIEQIGLLDENFWAWFEEVDFCKRAKNIGWKVYYTPEIEIIHHKGQSFNQLVKKQKVFNKSLLYYFKKHHSFLAWFILYLMQPLSLFLTFLDEKMRIKRRIGKKKYL